MALRPHAKSSLMVIDEAEASRRLLGAGDIGPLRTGGSIVPESAMMACEAAADGPSMSSE